MKTYSNLGLTRSTQYLLTLVHSCKLSLHRYPIHRFIKKLVVRESVLEHNHRIGPDVSAISRSW